MLGRTDQLICPTLTHTVPFAPPLSLLGLYSQGEGGTYSRKSHVSLPQGGGTCVGGGVLGAPFHDSVPPGEVGQGWASLSSSPLPNLPPPPSLPPAPQFFGVSLYIALWRDRGGRMDGVWGG